MISHLCALPPGSGLTEGFSWWWAHLETVRLRVGRTLGAAGRRCRRSSHDANRASRDRGIQARRQHPRGDRRRFVISAGIRDGLGPRDILADRDHCFSARRRALSGRYIPRRMVDESSECGVERRADRGDRMADVRDLRNANVFLGENSSRAYPRRLAVYSPGALFA